MKEIKLNNYKRFFEWGFLLLLIILMVGNPTLFTSMTRSVFEVNKLLLLRIITIVSCSLWFFKYILFKDNNLSNQKNCYHFLGFTWHKTGLEIPLLIWIFTNILSTIFSADLKTSIIGAYDRWEGIVTVTNYAILILLFAKLITTKKQLKWILLSLIGATLFSSFYGVLQSLGHDFMFWSKDPTYRVFACINNPVHFCAFVGMIVPIGISYLISIIKDKQVDTILLPNLKSNHTIAFILKAILYSTAFIIAVKTTIPTVYSSTTIQIICLTIITIILSETSKQSIPDKENIIKWSLFGILLFCSFMFDLVSFSKEQWVALLSLMILIVSMAPLPNLSLTLKRTLFFSISIIFYSQLLSFSRATWVGFMIAMPIFYILINKTLINFNKIKQAFTETILLIFFAGIFCLTTIFKVHNYHFILAIFIISLLITSLFFLIKIKKINILSTLPYILCFAFLLLDNSLLIIKQYPIIPDLKMIILGYLTYICYNTPKQTKPLIEQLVIIFLFSQIQFINNSMLNIFTFISLILCYYFVGLKDSSKLNKEKKFYLLNFLIMFGLITILPTLSGIVDSATITLIQSRFIKIPTTIALTICIFTLYSLLLLNKLPLIKDKKFQIRFGLILILIPLLIFPLKSKILNLKHSDTGKYSIAKNLQVKTANRYQNQLYTSARISMWKSAIPWFLDYPILGSGLDTVKLLYPVYRRPEYGILEGGHNYTPDRLHNEYLNTLVTKGIIGFIAFYFGLMGIWYFLSIKGFSKNNTHPLSNLLIGFMSSCAIYLIQVLFNFGVVATLVLFFAVMGLSLSTINIINNDQ
ncbi:hypothetical protein DID75_03165 [Candidatus Marinamargulisbacteria bacterium SCGC AG-410-N11]|nr:hypothetical protein DID75_03165 [Candidatus Marinamargulisbacteria bacterium SCGC AG-410-N11]